jgi:hypothetical protein
MVYQNVQHRPAAQDRCHWLIGYTAMGLRFSHKNRYILEEKYDYNFIVSFYRGWHFSLLQIKRMQSRVYLLLSQVKE